MSQVYGGSPSSTAGAYQRDYVELFNRGTTPVDITGWSLQFASATGNFGFSPQKVDLPSVVIDPGHYFLAAVWSPNTLTGTPVPADWIADAPVAGAGRGINLPSANGKLALVNTTDLLDSVACPVGDPRIVDFLGYGTSPCSEGGHAAPAISALNSAFRANGGCQDTSDNLADFGAGPALPRNSQTPVRSCAVTNPSGVATATPSSACRSGSVLLSVTVTPGANPTSTGISVAADLTAIGGSAGVPLASVGGGVYEGTVTVGPAVNFGNRGIPISMTDAQGRTGLTSVTVSVIDCTLRATVAANPPGVCNGEPTLLTVSVTPGQFPLSSGVTVTADLSAIGGSNTQAFTDDGTDGDVVAGDNVFSFTCVVPAGTPDGVAAVSPVVADAEGRSATPTLNLTHTACVPTTTALVISQIYGAGGQSTSIYRQDYIELYNRSSEPVDMSAYTLQITGNTGSFTTLGTNQLLGTLPPGGYWLIQFPGAGFGGAIDVPSPDDFGTLAAPQFAGKIALVASPFPLDGCPSPLISDLVGYGDLTNCSEGGVGPGTNNTIAIFRKGGGCQDTDNNAVDFYPGAPAPRGSSAPAGSCAPVCSADFNHDGDLNPDDLGDYITCYFTEPPCPGAEFNGDGDINPDDLGDFITAYFMGC